LKGQLLSESEGLLSALRLPNDLAPATPTVDSASEKSDRCVEKSPKHMEFLRKAGMIKLNESASTLHTVGLPSSLQNSIEKAILQNFMASSIMVSPPHMVRGAIIEAANLPKEMFPAFSDSTTQNASSTYLTGHGLLAFLAIFTKCHFKKSSNEWPIRVLSSGASYRNRTTTTTTSDKSLSLFTAGQRKKVAQLSICYSEEQESDEY
uniref:Bromodomain adjacent to zinc finger domain protein 2B n=1 Tax=Anisakis simplex TaxID=6269 RepID=A0A0M3J7V5_ANISI